MMRLPHRLWVLIFIKMYRNDIYNILVLKNFRRFDNSLWRVLFFKTLETPTGTWKDACTSLTVMKIHYYVKCFQCGRARIGSFIRPLSCIKCGLKLDWRETVLEQ